MRIGGVSTGCDKCSQPPGHHPRTSATTAVLQHVDRVGKARDAVLEVARKKTGRESVCEDQALALSKPLQASTGPISFEWENATGEFQSQDESLE